MTVREFLVPWVDDESFKVYQYRFKNNKSETVHLQSGSVDTLVNSGQAYLDCKIMNLQNDEGIIIITCKEPENKLAKVDAFNLRKRLDEIDGELQDWHISAYKSDLLYTEKDEIKAELKRRNVNI